MPLGKNADAGDYVKDFYKSKAPQFKGKSKAKRRKMAIAAYLDKKDSMKEADPKVGTGKKPKGSDRRLYTDENPKDTVSIKFATPADAKATVAKVKKIKKPYARKIQILTVGEQRAKVMGKNEVVSIFKKAKQDLKASEKRKRVDEDAPTVNTGSIPNPADTAMGPRFKTRTVHDRRKKKGMPLLLKRFRDYYAEKGIG